MIPGVRNTVLEMKVAVFSDLHTFQPDHSIVSKMSYQHFLNFCFYGNISS